MADHDDTLRQLDELLALPAGDPRREEALRDPALRALHDSYVAFLAADASGVPGLDRAEDALARLRGAVIMDGGEPRPVPASARTIVAAARTPWWQALFAPALRPALAFVVLLVAAGALWTTLRPPARPNVVVLRGGRSGELVVVSARPSERGVQLVWRRVAEADRYEVVFYTSQLTQIATLGETADTTALVPRSMRTMLQRGGTEVLFRVIARAAGDEIEHSPVATLPR